VVYIKIGAWDDRYCIIEDSGLCVPWSLLGNGRITAVLIYSNKIITVGNRR
jgi:hypothetical protein